MRKIDNFVNKVQAELENIYFPLVKHYKDNIDCAKVHYQTDLFNNGCIKYDVYIKSIANLCNVNEENIKKIVDKYIIFN